LLSLTLKKVIIENQKKYQRILEMKPAELSTTNHGPFPTLTFFDPLSHAPHLAEM
jgi:hypothetical protein